MAELVLKPVADFLISLAKTEIGLAWGVKNEVRMLSSALTTIGAVVADAELKQLNNKAIQQWLIKLNHAAYDALDVFDDLAIDEPELLQPDPTAENCCNSVWISCLSFFMLLKRLVPHYKIANKIKPVRERFDRIVNEMSNFGLIERVVDHVEGASMIPPQSISEDRVTSSASAEPRMYGRDADKENIIKMLLQNVDNEHGLSVCPILGIGGLGKTTLAQFVCKDDRVINHFDVRIWVCVSDHFNVKRLLKEIVEIVTKSRFDHDNFDVIRGGVLEQLRGKRFLLVLDDVWSDKQDVWNMLKDPLTTGAKGSSIIVTTRLKTVASITKTISDSYQLDGLLEDDCWSLFTFYAFEAGKESDNPNFVTIGKEIIKKCGGLPLAAKALGSMLRFKVEERQWREVRDSEIWELDEKEGSDQCPKILPALRLSYNNLSARARQCFAYCCFFSKDFEMRKEELVYIWLANGLLEFKNKEPEDVGEDVFGELLLHSFFQDMEENEDGKIETVTIHDLMHDLASAVMKSEYLHIEVKVGMSIDSSIQDDEIRPRHVSIIVLPSSSELSSVDVSSIHRFLSSHQCHLRTFFLRIARD
ncbi:hypothetical protein Syun_028907 [Stephania yunnanensis]|uniref:Uncharacterized protein n=1 Tax=Stephania yunnanensis TaxID=152371 RepID=A0AAP0ECB4_9MAGN